MENFLKTDSRTKRKTPFGVFGIPLTCGRE